MTPAARILRTARLTLRPLEARDLPGYLAYYTGPRTAHVGGALDAAKATERFCGMIGHWTLRGFGRYAIDLEGRAIGHVGPLRFVDETEFTWTIWDEAETGKGYAREAAAEVARHLFETCGWTRAVARIAPDNLPSRRIAEGTGGVLDPNAEAPAHWPEALTYRWVA